MIFICLNPLDGSLLAGDRANGTASGMNYRFSFRELTSSNGRWTSPLRCRQKRLGNEIAARDRERKQRCNRAALRTRAIAGCNREQLSSAALAFLLKIACFFCAFLGRMPTQSLFLGRTLRRRGAPVHERFVRYPKRQWWCDGIHHHALERSIGGARRNARCTESTRNTLSHLLATSLRLCPATRPWKRRSAGPGSGIFCAPARTQKSGHGPAREGTFAFLPACVPQTFPRNRAASR